MQQVSFLLLYRIFSLFPHAREKSCMSRKKTVLREKFGCRYQTAGLERAGSTGPGWRARPGWGPGQGRRGWGTCVFLHKNVRRNRLECSFGAEYRGENPLFFSGFFPRGTCPTGYSPRFPEFSPGKNPANLRGKSGAITGTKMMVFIS